MSGHIPAEDTAEIRRSNSWQCSYCGRDCNRDTAAWITTHWYNNPDVVVEYVVCNTCMHKETERREEITE